MGTRAGPADVESLEIKFCVTVHTLLARRWSTIYNSNQLSIVIGSI